MMQSNVAPRVDWSHVKTIRLETKKRDGSWVATPVSLVARDGRLFFRTYQQSGKAKRLRNFTEVRVAPCSFLGEPRGEAVPGRAVQLHGRDAAAARSLLRRKQPVLHAVLVPLAHRVMRYDTQHYELNLAEAR